MVLDRDSPAGELEDIGIVEHEGPAFLRGRLDDAGAVASALAINHAEGFATELLVDDRLVSRLCEKRLENDISVRVDGPLDHGFTKAPGGTDDDGVGRSEEHTSELQSLMRISYDDFCLKKKTNNDKPRNVIYT